MKPLEGAEAALVGGGVMGLATALELSRRGARCTLFDPFPLGDNASGVSAGMLAPAFESALDFATRTRFALLRDARDLWPTLLGERETGVLHREGALWIGDPPAVQDVALRLAQEGAAFEGLSAAAALKLQPLMATGAGEVIFTPDDWRLEPGAVLHVLQEELQTAAGSVRREAVISASARTVQTSSAEHGFDVVVICAGYGSKRLQEAAPELDLLRPIKGQRLRFPGGAPTGGPVVRSAAGYVTPGSSGPLVGATMEGGLDDRAITAEASLLLAQAAASLFPGLSGAPFEPAAGVRAETPDGLPLVGRSVTGVWVAAGARRNGWLLAPLAARLVADGLSDLDPGRWAEALRPSRFSSPA